MPVKDITEAVEVLNRFKHRGRTDWRVDTDWHLGPVVDTTNEPYVLYKPTSDLFIIANYYLLLRDVQPFIAVAMRIGNDDDPADIDVLWTARLGATGHRLSIGVQSTSQTMLADEWRALAAWKESE